MDSRLVTSIIGFIVVVALFIAIFIRNKKRLIKYIEKVGKIEYIMYNDKLYCIKGNDLNNAEEYGLVGLVTRKEHVKELEGLRAINVSIEPSLEKLSFKDYFKTDAGLKVAVEKLDEIEIVKFKGRVGYYMECEKKLLKLGDKKLEYNDKLGDIIGVEDATVVIRYNKLEDSRDVIEKYRVVKVEVD